MCIQYQSETAITDHIKHFSLTIHIGISRIFHTIGLPFIPARRYKTRKKTETIVEILSK